MSHYFSRRPWREYGLLPTSDLQSPPSLLSPKPSEKRHHNSVYAMLPSLRLPKRYIRLVLAFLIVLGVLSFLDIDWLPSPKLHPHPLEELEAQVPYPQLQETPPESDESKLPPLYDAYREYEDQLSERRVANQTASDRYIFFANHAFGCGWGNVLQEMVFDALLADRANIGYVWDDYTWDTNGAKYSDFNGRIIVSHVPLSTMLDGHILGRGPMNGSDPTKAPRAISSRIYEKMCPQHERVIIERSLVKAHLQTINSPINVDEAPGTDVLDAWLSLLDTPKYKNARCIEVKKGTEHVFDIWFFGSSRVQSLWESISHSAVLTHWGWSPLIYHAFEKNVHFFAADKDLHSGAFFGLWDFIAGSRHAKHASAAQSQTSNHSKGNDAEVSSPATTLARSASTAHINVNPRVLNASATLPLLVLHLRRGDFEEHCQNLAEWSSSYTGFNSFPASRVRDGFDVPRIVEYDNENDRRDISSNQTAQTQPERRSENDPLEVSSMAERKQVYTRHCFPNTRQVVKRVREVVRDYAAFAADRERARERKGGFWTEWWSREEGGEDGEGTEITLGGDEVETKRPLRIRGGGGYRHRHTHRARNRAVGNDALRKIYIMTNGDRAWLAEVKKALSEDAEGHGQPPSRRAAGADAKFKWVWESVSTSRDLQLGWEEKPVAQALDMYVAQRAEVFVGNGFSSLTSNIVMLRMKMGFDPVQTRFW